MKITVPVLRITFYGPPVFKSQQDLRSPTADNPAMTFCTAAAVAALELSPSSLATRVYAYHAILRFDLAVNARNVPQLVSSILAQIQLDEPDTVFTNGDFRKSRLLIMEHLFHDI
jgi:hypothetical protein